MLIRTIIEEHDVVTIYLLSLATQQTTIDARATRRARARGRGPKKRWLDGDVAVLLRDELQRGPRRRRGRLRGRRGLLEPLRDGRGRDVARQVARDHVEQARQRQ